MSSQDMQTIIALSVSIQLPQDLLSSLNCIDSCHLCHESPSVVQFLNEQGFCSLCRAPAPSPLCPNSSPSGLLMLPRLQKRCQAKARWKHLPSDRVFGPQCRGCAWARASSVPGRPCWAVTYLGMSEGSKRSRPGDQGFRWQDYAVPSCAQGKFEPLLVCNASFIRGH